MQQRAVLVLVVAAMLAASCGASSNASIDNTAAPTGSVEARSIGSSIITTSHDRSPPTPIQPIGFRRSDDARNTGTELDLENPTIHQILGGPPGLAITGQLYDLSLIKDSDPGTGDTFSREFTVLGGRVLFRANDPVYGAELWATDGTAAGTTLVKDINPGIASGFPEQFTVIGDQLVFVADDGVSGKELWVTDGTTAGTTLIKDINPGLVGGLSHSWPNSFTLLGDRAFFRASDGVAGHELWVTDGTTTGTTLVKDINPGPTGSRPDGFIVLGDRVLFSAHGGDSGELWVTDGTTAGTTLVKDINLLNTSPPVGEFAVFGDRLLFVADDGLSGQELWVTDGTTAGTTLVKDINPRPSISEPDWGPLALTVLDDRVVFTADGGDGYQLWVTDGTAAGTTLLKDISPDESSSGPNGFTVVGDRVLFTAYDLVGYGYGLWATDGTTAGTTLIKDINPGNPPSFFEQHAVFGDRVLFTAYEPDGSAYGLWVTDATASGTTQVKELTRTAGTARGTMVFDGHVMFVAPQGVWITDGTTAGTTLLRDNNGRDHYMAAGFTVIDGHALFASGVDGTELWSITRVLGNRIEDQITRLYQTAFDRSPDSAGLAYWAERNRRGFSLVQIADRLSNSAEFATSHGTDPTDTQVVDAFYQNVLGRPGDAIGRAHWITLINQGTSRANVLLAFSESPENINRTGTSAWFNPAQSRILRLYRAAFGRTPDITGFAFWTDTHQQGLSLTTIATQFRAAPEFAQRYGPDVDTEAFLRLLYTNVLDRAPDAAGLAFWLAQLDNNRTRDEVLVAFSESPEHISRTVTLD